MQINIPSTDAAFLSEAPAKPLERTTQPEWIHGDVENDLVLWNDMTQRYEHNFGQYLKPVQENDPF